MARDVTLLFTTRTLRLFSYGALAVVLVLYLLSVVVDLKELASSSIATIWAISALVEQGRGPRRFDGPSLTAYHWHAASPHAGPRAFLLPLLPFTTYRIPMR